MFVVCLSFCSLSIIWSSCLNHLPFVLRVLCLFLCCCSFCSLFVLCDFWLSFSAHCWQSGLHLLFQIFVCSWFLPVERLFVFVLLSFCVSVCFWFFVCFYVFFSVCCAAFSSIVVVSFGWPPMGTCSLFFCWCLFFSWALDMFFKFQGTFIYHTFVLCVLPTLRVCAVSLVCDKAGPDSDWCVVLVFWLGFFNF